MGRYAGILMMGGSLFLALGCWWGGGLQVGPSTVSKSGIKKAQSNEIATPPPLLIGSCETKGGTSYDKGLKVWCWGDVEEPPIKVKAIPIFIKTSFP